MIKNNSVWETGDSDSFGFYSGLCALPSYSLQTHLWNVAYLRTFSSIFPKCSGVVPVTYNVYNRYIKYFLNLIGLDNKLYSSHSFRRGGTTLSFSSKVSSELIQIHGDWASDAYAIYLEFSLKDELLVFEYLTKTLLSHFR